MHTTNIVRRRRLKGCSNRQTQQSSEGVSWGPATWSAFVQLTPGDCRMLALWKCSHGGADNAYLSGLGVVGNGLGQRRRRTPSGWCPLPPSIRRVGGGRGRDSGGSGGRGGGTAPTFRCMVRRAGGERAGSPGTPHPSCLWRRRGGRMQVFPLARREGIARPSGGGGGW